MNSHRLLTNLFGLLLLLCATVSLEAQTPQQVHNQVRVMSYNVRHGQGLDEVLKPERIGQLLNRYALDVVALQEVDSCTERVDGRNLLQEWADQTGLHPTYAKAIPFQGGGYGVGILSKEQPLSVRRVSLPGREEPRMLLMAEFERYVFACTHLSLTEEDRMASLPIIQGEAQRAGKPFILAGDWNDEPTSPFLQQMRAHFDLANGAHSQESWNFSATFPADRPNVCIDYIGIYRPTSQGLIPSGLARPVAEKVASDHRPLMGVLQFKMPADQLLYHQPYLQRMEPEGVTILYQTRALAHSWVEYGTDTLSLATSRQLAGGQEVVHDVEHRVRLEQLTPGATYYYRVCVQEIVNSEAYSKTFGDTYRTPFFRFQLPTAQTKDFTALIFNDMHMVPEVMQAMSRLAARTPHDLVVFNGDCLPEPTDRDHALQIVHTLADLFDGAQVPIDFLRGNHEIRNNYSSGMLSLFETANGQTYHAFSWGDTRFVMLDCGEDKPDDHWVYYGLNDFTQFRQDQVAFLQQELKHPAFKRASRRILIHHIPLWYGTADNESGEVSLPCRNLWLPALQKARFDVSLNAHTHQFASYAKGELGNPYPVVVGGGPSLKEATMLVLQKQGKSLTLRALNAAGEELLHLVL